MTPIGPTPRPSSSSEAVNRSTAPSSAALPLAKKKVDASNIEIFKDRLKKRAEEENLISNEMPFKATPYMDMGGNLLLGGNIAIEIYRSYFPPANAPLTINASGSPEATGTAPEVVLGNGLILSSILLKIGKLGWKSYVLRTKRQALEAAREYLKLLEKEAKTPEEEKKVQEFKSWIEMEEKHLSHDKQSHYVDCGLSVPSYLRDVIIFCTDMQYIVEGAPLVAARVGYWFGGGIGIISAIREYVRSHNDSKAHTKWLDKLENESYVGNAPIDGETKLDREEAKLQEKQKLIPERTTEENEKAKALMSALLEKRIKGQEERVKANSDKFDKLLSFCQEEAGGSLSALEENLSVHSLSLKKAFSDQVKAEKSDDGKAAALKTSQDFDAAILEENAFDFRISGLLKYLNDQNTPNDLTILGKTKLSGYTKESLLKIINESGSEELKKLFTSNESLKILLNEKGLSLRDLSAVLTHKYDAKLKDSNAHEHNRNKEALLRLQKKFEYYHEIQAIFNDKDYNPDALKNGQSVRLSILKELFKGSKPLSKILEGDNFSFNYLNRVIGQVLREQTTSTGLHQSVSKQVESSAIKNSLMKQYADNQEMTAISTKKALRTLEVEKHNQENRFVVFNKKSAFISLLTAIIGTGTLAMMKIAFATSAFVAFPPLMGVVIGALLMLAGFAYLYQYKPEYFKDLFSLFAGNSFTAVTLKRDIARKKYDIEAKKLQLSRLDLKINSTEQTIENYNYVKKHIFDEEGIRLDQILPHVNAKIQPLLEIVTDKRLFENELDKLIEEEVANLDKLFENRSELRFGDSTLIKEYYEPGRKQIVEDLEKMHKELKLAEERYAVIDKNLRDIHFKDFQKDMAVKRPHVKKLNDEGDTTKPEIEASYHIGSNYNKEVVDVIKTLAEGLVADVVHHRNDETYGYLKKNWGIELSINDKTTEDDIISQLEKGISKFFAKDEGDIIDLVKQHERQYHGRREAVHGADRVLRARK